MRDDLPATNNSEPVTDFIVTQLVFDYYKGFSRYYELTS